MYLTDNLPKGIFDSMEGIVFDNDSRICREYEKGKFYAKTPGVIIELKGI